MNNKNGKTRYIVYRIRLEKTKQGTWLLIVLAKALGWLKKRETHLGSPF